MMDHGTRTRYRYGCRCAACRAANTAYEVERRRRSRAGTPCTVPAARAREHLLWLREQGVGRRAVSAVTDLAAITIHRIAAGDQPRIRAETERLILAVTPALHADRARVPAAPTLERLADLLEEGYSMAFLARRLGYPRHHTIRVGRRGWVYARTEYRIERLHRELTT